ncbi:MAG: ATP synthase F1 subunit gamma [Erysipelotrichaceae bacterium]|nr:ATP synthase F1 subunit gamma [Erysipelotrichaceae bacterium]
MAGQVSTIRRQLKSVRSTQKITNAMSLVSTAKLQKQRARMEENSIYSEEFHTMLLSALSGMKEADRDNVYFRPNRVDNPLHIIITSNSGLCGSYNMDLLRYVEKTVNKMDPIFAIGSYGIKWLDSNNYMVIKRFDELDDLEPAVINKLIDNSLELYRRGEISKFDIIYTQYVNTLTFTPATYELLPLEIPKEVEEREVEFAPDLKTVLDNLIPEYISAIVYSTFLEARTSEHAARRSAMDSANKNAQSLIDEISLRLNQARQASITQEVNEITAGADAL